MFKAWKAYGKDTSIVLIIHEIGEKNIFDQRAVEFELTKMGIRCRRTIFPALYQQLTLSNDSVLTFNG